MNARFWAKVDKTGECWEWTGARIPKGYGQFRVGAVVRSAHRLAYEALIGPIPEGMEIDHTCHTRDKSCPGGNTCPHRRCVNPAHLEAVTPMENTRRGVNYCPEVCRRGHRMTDARVTWNKTRQRWHRACRTCVNEGAARRRQTRKQVA